MEIDYILDFDGVLTPFEVKWTENPDSKDARHLRTFLEEHPTKATESFVVCRCPRPAKLADNVTATPWWSF